MNKNKQHLFNQKLIIDYLSSIEIPTEKIVDITQNVFNLDEKSITMGKTKGNEENVKNKIIVKILNFLGFDEQRDLDFEKSSLRGSIDIAIKLSEKENKPKVLIEVKYWKKDLDKIRKESKYKSDVQQGLIYALESGIEWFIITNGYEWRFYKTFISGQIVYNFFEDFNLDSLKIENNLKKFYLLFSKESFKKDLQDKFFSETELIKEKINEEIFDILVNSRSELFLNIFKNNKSIIDEKQIMESGQKILDRLVFLRFAEDNNLFSNKPLKKYLNIWNDLPTNMKERNPLYDLIKDLFSYIREGSEKDDIFGYDGELFDKDNLLNKLVIDSEVFERIINNLYYYPDGKYIDFAEIPIDILGHIYEKYLALSLNIKEVDSKLVLKEDLTRKIRKKTGIYYTPKYTVHFILDHTILRVLNESIDILPNLKVVDPACGSGAFLSQAYDLFYLKYGEYNEIISTKTAFVDQSMDMLKYTELSSEYKKNFDTKILTNNIFGVDINPESVEITKMSLWFKTAQKNVPLNKLEANIKCGDSLIEERELSKDKAFDWRTKFPDVFEEGGFDIVIGNPPYFKIQKDNPLTKTKDYKEIKMAFVNAAALFINRTTSLLKNGGILGFIVPKQLAFTNSWHKLRKKIFDNFKINFLIDCHKAFEKVLLEQVIIIMQKTRDNRENSIKLGKATGKNIIIDGEVEQELCRKEDMIFLQFNDIIKSIKEKCEINSNMLGDISEMQLGLGINRLKNESVFTKQKTKDSLVLISGNDIQKYYIRDCLYFDKTHPKLKKYENRIVVPPKLKIVA